MNVQTSITNKTNKRAFDRITVKGAIRVAGKNYAINDLSIGGLSVQGRIPRFNPSDIRRVQFKIRHGELEVVGKINCECLDNSLNSVTRLKFVEPSEDLTEFFRAATLRSVSGSEYDAGWLAETSMPMHGSEVRPRRSPASRLLSLSALIAVMLAFLFSVFLLRTTTAEAFWVMDYHEVVSPVAGQIKLLQSGPFAAGELVLEVSVTTASGAQLTMPITANVSSVAVDWRVSPLDYVKAGDILGYVHNVPENDGRVRAIVALTSPFASPNAGTSIVFKSELGERIVGKMTQWLNPRQVIEYARINNDIDLNNEYVFVEFDVGVPAFLGRPEIQIFDTLIENWDR